MSNEERWLPVPGFEDYEVSDQGRVRWAVGGRRRNVGGFPKTWLDDQGYRRVMLTRDGRQKTKMVHVLVATAFLGERPEGKEVNHKNGIKGECPVSNLEYLTPKANVAHAHANGLAVVLRGTHHGNALLTEEKVRRIRELAQSGLKHHEVGEMFGVCASTVQKVCSRRAWGHVV